jgi:hypothetical protein
MGYTTNFEGELKFTTQPSKVALAYLVSFFGEDCRNHPEWEAKDLYSVDLMLNRQLDGIKHDGSEKTYDLEKIVNVVIVEMRKEFPDFGLTGQLLAQGEDITDRWVLAIENGMAVKKKQKVTGDVVMCPDCGHQFLLP